MEHASPQLAIVSVESLFAVSQSLAKEPLVRSYLARMDCQGIAVGSLQNLLSKTSLTDAELDALRIALEKADDQRGLARAFIGQRCIGIHGFNLMRETFDLTALPAARKYPWAKESLSNSMSSSVRPRTCTTCAGFSNGTNSITCGSWTGISKPPKRLSRDESPRPKRCTVPSNSKVSCTRCRGRGCAA